VPAKLRAALPFLLILFLAAGLRFYALERIPPGIYWDEVIDGHRGLEAVRTRQLKVFYPVGSGREGLWINLTGVAEAVLGANPIGLRFCAALVGTLTVLAVYLLARELFSDRIARFTAWFLATGFWPLWISRMCYRAVLMPLFLTPRSICFCEHGAMKTLQKALPRNGSWLSLVEPSTAWGSTATLPFAQPRLSSRLSSWPNTASESVRAI